MGSRVGLTIRHGFGDLHHIGSTFGGLFENNANKGWTSMREKVTSLVAAYMRKKLLEQRLKDLQKLRGASLVDRLGNELFVAFDAGESRVIREALIKHYEDEIEGIKLMERTAVS